MLLLASTLVCLLLVAPPEQDPGVAQAEPHAEQEPHADVPDAKPPTPTHTGVRASLHGLKADVAHLPSMPNLYLAAIGGGLAAGAHPFDQDVNARLRSHYAVVNRIFAPAKYVGGTGEQMAFSIGTWVLGRVTHKPKVAHLGMDLLRAQAVSEILVEPLKVATRRARPDGSDHRSFPSGHAAVTFAVATVIERHLGWKHSIAAYAIASYVAASRLHDNRHYLSDVVFGAAVGSIAGRTVTQHGRQNWALVPIAVPGGAGVLIARAGS